MANIEEKQVIQALDILRKTHNPPTAKGFYIAEIQEVLNKFKRVEEFSR